MIGTREDLTIGEYVIHYQYEVEGGVNAIAHVLRIVSTRIDQTSYRTLVTLETLNRTTVIKPLTEFYLKVDKSKYPNSSFDYEYEPLRKHIPEKILS